MLFVVNCNAVHRWKLIDTKEHLEQLDCPISEMGLNRMEYDSYQSQKYLLLELRMP